MDIANKEKLRKEIVSSPRRYWSYQYMVDKLFEGIVKKGHDSFYETLSWHSHPNIKGAFNDFVITQSVEDLTKTIQDLCFQSTDIFVKTFQTSLSPDLNRLITDNQTLIGTHLKVVVNYKPKEII